MKIALIGATGTICQRILGEALDRGHDVTSIVHNTSRLTLKGPLGRSTISQTAWATDL